MVDQPNLLKFPPPQDATAGASPAGDATPPTRPETVPQAVPQTLLCLEITRGRTAYPYRPIEKPKFRLGSGPACDLRLGGKLAPVHSMILVESGRAWAEQVAADPPLTVNGTPRRRSDLQAGDRLQVGEFEMVFWRIDWDPALLGDLTHPDPDRPDPSRPDNDPDSIDAAADMDIETSLAELAEFAALIEAESLDGTPDDALPDDAADLARLSAAELIELIEQEEALVAEFEAGRERGAAALLFRVAMQAAELRQMDETPVVALESEADAVPEPDAECAGEADCLPMVRPADTAAPDDALLGELEEVVGRLSEFSAQLDRRAERLAERELTQAEAAAGLLAAQDELASQLERLHEQLAAPPRHERQPPIFRKAA